MPEFSEGPGSPYPYTVVKVRKVWVFAIERDYRLAQRINRGEFDEEAECEMLLHNIRLADRLGKTEEANKLRKRHRDLEIHRSGMSEIETMRSLVLQQSAMIEQMRSEIEMLKKCKTSQ